VSITVGLLLANLGVSKHGLSAVQLLSFVLQHGIAHLEPAQQTRQLLPAQQYDIRKSTLA